MPINMLDTIVPLHVDKLGADLSESINLLFDWLLKLTLTTAQRGAIFREYLKQGPKDVFDNLILSRRDT